MSVFFYMQSNSILTTYTTTAPPFNNLPHSKFGIKDSENIPQTAEEGEEEDKRHRDNCKHQAHEIEWIKMFLQEYIL